MIFVVFFLLFISNTNASTLKVCPKCGSMEVPYPLSTNQNCGFPKYKLLCNNGTLQFESANNLFYKVLQINLNKNRLVIEPPLILPKTCRSLDLVFGGFRIDDESPFNISSSNTVMLFNCSDTILLSPLNCSSTSPCRVFENETKCGYGCRNMLCCSYLKDSSMTSRRIRIRFGGCSAYTSVVNFKIGESVDAWNFGIELQWMPPN